MRTPPRSILGAILAAVLAAGALTACGSTTRINHFAGLTEEWGMPSSGRPHALMLLIPGGGWKATHASDIAKQLNDLKTNLQGLGYETLAFSYRAGAQSVRDAETVYRVARARVGPKLPICALGLSAGGHLALMLAVDNPDLACVVAFAGPTDLPALASESKLAYGLARQAFGTRQLARYSPALNARSIHAKVLLMYADNDPIVPVAQGQAMARALPGSQLIELPPGNSPFVHSYVATDPYDKALATTESFIAQAARSWRGK